MMLQDELFPDLPPIPERLPSDPDHRPIHLHTHETGIDCLSSFGASITAVCDVLRGDGGAAAAAAGATWMRLHGNGGGSPEVIQVAGVWAALVEELRGLGWTIEAPS